jgi:hypothetical protein
MVKNQAETGAVFGAAFAGLLTLIGGGLLLIRLAPDSNLGPIVGIFVAPPAAIMGLFLGAAVGSWRLSATRAAATGCLVGAVLGGAFLWKVSDVEFAKNPAGCIVLSAFPAFVFSVTGLVVRRSLGPLRGDAS